MPVATVEEFKEYLEWRGTASDEFLETILAAATSFVERETGHQFTPEGGDVGDDDVDPVEKTVSSRGSSFVAVPDLREAVTVTVAGTEIAKREVGDTSGYNLFGQAPHTSIRLTGVTFDAVTDADVVIAGRWGHIPVPPDVKDAILALGARMVRERAASYADTIADPESGILAYYRQLPPRVHGVIESWTKPRMVIGL